MQKEISCANLVLFHLYPHLHVLHGYTVLVNLASGRYGDMVGPTARKRQTYSATLSGSTGRAVIDGVDWYGSGNLNPGVHAPLY